MYKQTWYNDKVSLFRVHYPPADEYLNHAEKSDMTLVEAFKRMQVIEDEETEDALDENGEPDEEVLHVECAFCYPCSTYYEIFQLSFLVLMTVSLNHCSVYPFSLIKCL